MVEQNPRGGRVELVYLLERMIQVSLVSSLDSIQIMVVTGVNLYTHSDISGRSTAVDKEGNIAATDKFVAIQNSKKEGCVDMASPKSHRTECPKSNETKNERAKGQELGQMWCNI
jgi:hypothetical protein